MGDAGHKWHSRDHSFICYKLSMKISIGKPTNWALEHPDRTSAPSSWSSSRKLGLKGRAAKVTAPTCLINRTHKC